MSDYALNLLCAAFVWWWLLNLGVVLLAIVGVLFLPTLVLSFSVAFAASGAWGSIGIIRTFLRYGPLRP